MEFSDFSDDFILLFKSLIDVIIHYKEKDQLITKIIGEYFL
ncbi:hypothetical protein SAMN05421856_10153 [Chryseobacterium taichungense]|uniref:Uncharacterized protein n=1 Tax=Chryseobacterium taichungense TaxID=295069 RepID=A0A1H7VKG5_9FLAO|nr:hypothetical protein SAMN05421856_10153 [Chryseobacterium taichungense]